MSDRNVYDLDDLTGLLVEGRISRREFMLGGVGLGLSLGTVSGLIRAAEASAAPRVRLARGGTVTCGVVNAVGKFDPHGWSGFTSNIATNHIYQGLVRLNFNTNAVEPCLASSWEQPNPTTYVYHLRRGVLFHNATELTADDVVFSVLRAKKVSWGAYGLANFKSIRARDKYTVEVKLSKPDWRFRWFEYWPPGAILSKKYFDQVGETTATQKPIGTNAFKLTSSSQDQVVLEAFKDYWEKGLPYLSKVTLKVLDGTTIVAGLKTGEIQLSPDIGFDQLKLVESFANVDVKARVGPHIVQTYMNMTKAPFNDVNVRKAIAEALDNRAALSAYPAQFYAPSRGAMIHPSFPYSAYSTVNKVYTANLAKARAYLQKSSAPNGFTTEWTVAATRPQELSAVLGAQERLSKIGIKVNIKKLPDPDVAGATYARPRPFQMITYNWLHNMPNALDPLAALLTTAALPVSNFSGYSNKQFDRLVGEAIVATKPRVIGDKLRRLQLMHVRDVPILVHGWDAIRRAESTKLKTPHQTILGEWDDWFRTTQQT
jgi:peptide/nickel transport system substrate-binding protein